MLIVSTVFVWKSGLYRWLNNKINHWLNFNENLWKQSFRFKSRRWKMRLFSLNGKFKETLIRIEIYQRQIDAYWLQSMLLEETTISFKYFSLFYIHIQQHRVFHTGIVLLFQTRLKSDWHWIRLEVWILTRNCNVRILI